MLKTLKMQKIYIDKQQIEELEKQKRVHLINSLGHPDSFCSPAQIEACSEFPVKQRADKVSTLEHP